MAYKNKEDQATCARKHYLNNKEIYRKRARLQNIKTEKRNRAFIEDFLLKNPCVNCGEKDIIVLDFDHVRGKKNANVADLVKGHCSIEKIQLEIDKCEVRCANCHRRITRFRRNV